MQDPTVFIVDDDQGMCSSLRELVESVGLEAEAFCDAETFLSLFQDRHGCLLLDVRMPGMSGIELHERLVEDHCIVPTIFITGHGDITMAVRSIKRGAYDFIEKPFRPQALLDRIQDAIAVDRANRGSREAKRRARENEKKLTPRETEIMHSLAQGRTNNEIAQTLNLSPKTVRIHRSRIFTKMGVDSPVQLAEQVRLLNDDNVH